MGHQIKMKLKNDYELLVKPVHAVICSIVEEEIVCRVALKGKCVGKLMLPFVSLHKFEKTFSNH